MNALSNIPILNVSNMAESFAWFEKLGWSKLWEWGEPTDFGAVGSGAAQVFLCLDGQGSRGRSPMLPTYDRHGKETGDKGVWLCIMVEDVDEVHRHCLAQGIEIGMPPWDAPWNLREMHVRHPDGHILRIGHSTAEGAEDEIENFAERVREQGPPLPIERVDVPVRLEKRLAAALADLARHKGLSLGETLEETLLHTFERMGFDGVPSPHTVNTLKYIQELKRRHGMDYDCHASYRFVEAP